MHRRQHRHGAHPGPPVDTAAGRRRIVASLLLSVAAALLAAGSFVAVGAVFDAGPDVRRVLTVACLTALALVAEVASGWLSVTGARREEVPRRERLLRRWWDGSAGERDHESAGATVELLTESVERVSNYRQTFLGPMLGAALGPLAVLVLLAVAVDAVVAVALALVLPLIPLTVLGFSRAFRRVSGGSRRARAHLADRYLEAIQGLETITLLGAAGRVEADLARVGEANRRATMRLLAGNQVVLFVTDAVFSLGVVTSAVVLAAWRLDAGAIGPGDAIAVVLCAILLLQPLDRVGSFFYVGMSGMASQRAIRRFLAHETAAPPASTTPEPQPTGRGAGPVVDVVDASLGHGAAPVVSQARLRLEAGCRVAVVGPSGGGKTTLLRALKGDVLPSGGSIVVDGIASSAGTRDDVRAASALVSQTTWLFTGTMADNLRLGAPLATDDQLWDVLEQVDLADFVRRSPRGLDTLVGERGHAVSGGQAQRISLARAVLSGRRLLLLDEPTAHVDLESEAIILDLLRHLPADRSLVMTTHRPAIAAAAESVWELRDGTLAEVTHA